MSEHIFTSRDEARASGARYFFTGLPCKHGHVAERSVSENKCRVCLTAGWAKVRRRLGHAEKRINTARDEALERGEKQYDDNLECPKGHGGRRWTRNRACVICTALAARAANKRAGYKWSAEWAKKNRQRIIEIKAKYRASDKGRLSGRICSNLRRSRKKGNGGHYTVNDVGKIRALQRNKCAYCKGSIKTRYEIDHIVALSKGGSNEPKNLQLLCPSCNARKWNKDPIDFAQKNGLLL